jgi:hypothetical protein
LTPQIKAKYPSAPLDKINKVILQKWNTIDPQKKELYIRKVMRKLEIASNAASKTEKAME